MNAPPFQPVPEQRGPESGVPVRPGGPGLAPPTQPQRNAPHRPNPSALPDPVWADAPVMCLNCGYSLEGLEAPGVCPECSTPFEQRLLWLAGMVKRAKTPFSARQLGMIVCGVLVFLSIQFGFIAYMVLGRTFLIVLAGLIVTLVALIVTRPRGGKHEGAIRLVCGTGGIAFIPLKGEPRPGLLGESFHPWGEADAASLDRVSPFWRTLRVGAVGGDNVLRPTFEAGVRCPDEHEALVIEALNGMLAHKTAPPIHPPTEPPTEPSTEPLGGAAREADPGSAGSASPGPAEYAPGPRRP
ncbi:MAG: hypothetical protein KDA05_08140 [Phycisphaerales bacterium]|nr:hypothetical protein [Phycisphaerales bacterium]MCB9840579.1 hypothetical protein [Phycisphaeraceae bacterium]